MLRHSLIALRHCERVRRLQCSGCARTWVSQPASAIKLDQALPKSCGWRNCGKSGDARKECIRK